MKHYLLHIFVIVVFTSILNCSCNILLIKDYLRTNHLKTLLLISCENKFMAMDQFGVFHGIWINIWDISDESMLADFNYNRFFGRYSHPHGVAINLECNKTNSLLTELSGRTLFHNERFWLMFNSLDVEETFAILNPQNINVDAEMVLAIPSNDVDQANSYKIYEVFNPSSSHGARLSITQFGSWNTIDGFNINVQQTKIERRRDLCGITLSSVISLTNIPNQTTYIEHLNSDKLTHLDSVNRLMYRVFVLMMDMHNFKIAIRLSSIWGFLDKNGKWHGALGMINRSEVDLCMAGLRLDNQRYGAFEYTTHAYHAQVQFIFRHPKSIAAANLFLLPFEGILWYAMIVFCLLGALIVRVSFLLAKELAKKSKPNTDLDFDSTFSNSLLMVFGFIFQQSYSGNTQLTSTRVLIMTMLLFSLLMFQFYSAFIVGSLLTEAPKNIKTVKQLLNSPFKFGIDEVPYVIDNFHGAKEESTVQLYNKIMKNPDKVIMPLQKGLHLMKQGGFAFNTDGSYAYIILRDILSDTEKCELQEISYIPKLPAGPAVPNKSPFKELIKISIRRITETGILSYHHKVWYGTRPKCEVSDLMVAPVDTVHFSSAIYMLIVGIVSSLCIFFIEIIVHRYSERQCRVDQTEVLFN